MARMRTLVVVLAVVATIVAGTGIALADFPQTAPNDPGYAPAEGSPANCLTHSVNEDQYHLYSFIPQCAKATAHDPENAAGMSADAAWRDYTTGRPDTVIAYVEGGINWHSPDARDLVDKVYLNKGELPLPYGSTTYDANHDGVFNVEDYAHDPRVHDTNGNGYLDPEDLIVAFSNGKDDDHDGYVDDISGWDFYDNQNDPATYDSAYGHSDNQMRQAAAQTNNGFEGAGVCPGCMILPIKAGAEALDRTDDLAQAWWFAADSGASVIVSVTADLGYSSFMRQTVEALWRKGVIMAESSNDFDSTDHQGGMFWPHVLPGNGILSSSAGVPGTAANALTTNFRERSDLTSFGTHNMFSVPTQGGSTSESTPTIGGAAALVSSYGRVASDQGLIHGALSGPEVVQVLRATASDIDDPTLRWPGAPGWDLQYGYGRPNLDRAMHAISTDDIPPVGWITSPDWYSIYDPTVTSRVPVQGHVEAKRSTGYSWTLQFAPGAQPTDSQFVTAGTGTGTTPRDTTLGTLDLSKIPPSFWNAPYQESHTKSLEATEQYTVTIRLRVTDAHGRVGEDRRTIAVHHDPALRTGAPLRFGIGGESQTALVDLQGTGHLAAVFGDADGRVHAIDPTTGHELPGWPARTDPTVVTKTHAGIDPGHESIVASVAVGDLDHDGHLWVVATSTAGKVYVFDSTGHRRPGWPLTMNHGVVPPPIPRPALPHTRLPVQGATASPVLDDLNGDGHLDVVQAGWDGYLHAWDANAKPLPGWPVHVTLPAGFTPPAGTTIVNDNKLDATATIADLDGNHRPEIVVRSQYSAITGDGIQPGGTSYLFAYHANGTPVAGWQPLAMPGLLEYYGSAQEFITEGSDVPVAADVNGDGRDEIESAPVFTPPRLFGGNGTLMTTYGSDAAATSAFLSILGNRAGLLTGSVTPVDIPISFTTSGVFGRVGGGPLSFVAPATSAGSMAAALLVPSSGFGIHNLDTAYDAATGAPRAGYPTTLQGLDFLGAALVTDVNGDGKPDVVDTTDSSALSAHDGAGALVTGFPRFTGGWALWSASAGDVAASGTNDVVVVTREGYLFDWKTAGRASANSEWWTYHHDEHRTGRYGVDTRPPGTLRDLRRAGRTVTFTAPGDDWYDGRALGYLVLSSKGFFGVLSSGPAGTTQTITLPAGAQHVGVVAVDAAGNFGPLVLAPGP